MNSSKAMISVIIPVYNGEQTIARACQSVLNQDYPNIELIVVDDGSSDQSAAVAESFAKSKEGCIVIRQTNGGVSKARNTGIAAARGAYIMFLDADDEMAPGCMTQLMKFSEMHDCDIVCGTCIRVRQDGSRYHEGYSMDAELELWQGEEAFLLSLQDHPSTYAVWDKLYRRAAIGDTRFTEGRKLHEDSFFLFELLRKDLKVAITQTAVVLYYLTDNSASRAAFSEKFLDMLYFAERKYDIVQTNYPHLLSLGKNVLVKGNMALLKNMWKPGAEDYRDIECQCQRAIRENAAYFISAIKVDRIIFAAVRLHIFWLYKWVYRILKG